MLFYSFFQTCELKQKKVKNSSDPSNGEICFKICRKENSPEFIKLSELRDHVPQSIADFRQLRNSPSDLLAAKHIFEGDESLQTISECSNDKFHIILSEQQTQQNLSIIAELCEGLDINLLKSFKSLTFEISDKNQLSKISQQIQRKKRSAASTSASHCPTKKTNMTSTTLMPELRNVSESPGSDPLQRVQSSQPSQNFQSNLSQGDRKFEVYNNKIVPK